MKHLRKFESFRIDERLEDLIQNINHMVKVSQFRDGELYSTQNSNLQQSLTTDGKLVEQSKITTPYCIGKGGNLTCYNCDSYFGKHIIYEDNSDFLEAFNKAHNTNYSSVSFDNYYGR